jgi:hypothetical protein
LIHVLASSGVLHGAVWVNVLIDLALTRPELLHEVAQVLAEDAMDQYPGVLRKALARWEGQQPWGDAAHKIAKSLSQHQEDWAKKASVPELSYSPTSEEWRLAQQSQLDEAYRDAQETTLVAQIATRVPIARGEGSSGIFGDPSQPTPFQHFETSMEYPALDVIDPVAAMLRRFSRRQHAEKLITQADKEEHADSP